MKIVGIFPIKLTNERLPGKNTKEFSDGTPLIYFVQRNLIATDIVDEVYCYCSDESVEKYLLDGVKLKVRDKRLDLPTVTSNDILSEIAKEIVADIYVYAMATAPFLKPESIKNAIKMVASGEHDSAMPVIEMRDYLWKDGKALNFDPNNTPRSQDLEPVYLETCGVFIINRDVILDGGRRIGRNPYMFTVNSIEAIDIDYPEDFLIAEAIYSTVIKRGKLL